MIFQKFIQSQKLLFKILVMLDNIHHEEYKFKYEGQSVSRIQTDIRGRKLAVNRFQMY